ncbi:hypothetical protein [Blastopirellula marina]|uniref:hypothetical protein n=1 Tax=Blastopirellula marina TaxID=124 RepID=UPI001304B6B0|nr:hypothetical protein [Blastopirellula marina]
MFKSIAFLLIFAFLGLGVAGLVLAAHRGLLFLAATLCLIVGYAIWNFAVEKPFAR